MLNVTFDECQFDSNHVTDDGGAIYAADSFVSMIACYAVNNNATDDGAVAYTNDANMEVSCCIFDK